MPRKARLGSKLGERESFDLRDFIGSVRPAISGIASSPVDLRRRRCDHVCSRDTFSRAACHRLARGAVPVATRLGRRVMTARALCLARPPAAAARRRRGAGTGSRRRVVPASSSPSPASASDDASAFDLPPCVATVTRVDASGRRREFYVVGTVHTPGSASAEEVRAVIERVRPDAVVLELDQERLDALVDTALHASSTTPAGSGSSPAAAAATIPPATTTTFPRSRTPSPLRRGTARTSSPASPRRRPRAPWSSSATPRRARSPTPSAQISWRAPPRAPRRPEALAILRLRPRSPRRVRPRTRPNTIGPVLRRRDGDARSVRGRVGVRPGEARARCGPSGRRRGGAPRRPRVVRVGGGGANYYSVEAVAAGAMLGSPMGSPLGGSVGTGSAGWAAFFSPSSAFGFFSVFAGLFGALAFGRSAEVLLRDRDDVLADAARARPRCPRGSGAATSSASRTASTRTRT